MRQRFNRNAICSSENYKASRNAHLEQLKENHNSICIMAKSDKLDTPKSDDIPISWCVSAFSTPVMKTVKIFDKFQKVTQEEYEKYYKQFGF